MYFNLRHNVCTLIAGICMAEESELKELKLELEKLIGTEYYEGDGDGIMTAVLKLLDVKLK